MRPTTLPNLDCTSFHLLGTDKLKKSSVFASIGCIAAKLSAASAIVATSLQPAFATENEYFHGTLGDIRVSMMELGPSYLNGIGCSEFFLPISIQENSQGNLVAHVYDEADYDYDLPKATVPVSRATHELSGIPMETFSAIGIPLDGQHLELRLKRSLSPNFSSWTGPAASCPDAGWVPGSIIVVVSPGSWRSVQEWTAANDSAFVFSINNNTFFLDVPVGFEDDLIEKIRTEEWLLDARREGEVAGPEYASVDFPINSLLTDRSTQNSVGSTLKTALSKIFPGIDINDITFRPRRGYAYTLDIFSYVQRLGLNDRDFDGYWLKTHVDFELSRQLGLGGDPHERLIVNIRDGWLPRYPSDQPPPEAHWRQFHLQPSDGKLTGFYTLKWLLSRIASSFAEHFGGEANIPDYY